MKRAAFLSLYYFVMVLSVLSFFLYEPLLLSCYNFSQIIPKMKMHMHLNLPILLDNGHHSALLPLAQQCIAFSSML